MKFKGHFTLECIIMIPLGVILYYFLREIVIIPMILLSIYIGAMLPDIDLKLDKSTHRNIWFHSITVLTIYLFMSLQYPSFALFITILNVSVGVHLLGDCKINRSKMMGYYCICYWKGKRLNGLNSTLWLLGNFTLSVIILVMYVRWFY